MAKRFINPNWKELRKLSSRLREAWFYVWDKADACGMYAIDTAYMKADLGFVLSAAELAKLPGAKLFPGDRIFLTDFILVNYGELKVGYNPHKPAFRALEQNRISDLTEARTKLEEEDVDEEEDKGEEAKGGAGGKRFIPPDVEQVAAYMAEVNYPGIVQEEADSFVNHYTGNGWMRGKNKVKDWQAVVRTWKKRKNEEHGQQQTRVKTGAKGQHDAATVAESIKRNFDPLYQSANAG